MNATNYFDLKEVLINELVGTTTLFLFVGLVVILILALKSRMPWQPLSLLALTWVSIVFAANTNLIFIWVLVVLGASGLFYYGISRLLNR